MNEIRCAGGVQLGVQLDAVNARDGGIYSLRQALSRGMSLSSVSEPARVRAVVLNYSSSRLALRCVEDLRRQSYPALDVVVVDNCSPGDDAAFLETALPADVSLLLNQQNRGYAAGNNAGLRDERLPRPEFDLIVNPDVQFPDRTTVEQLVAALERDSRRAAVSPLVGPHVDGPQVRRIISAAHLMIAGSWWLGALPGLRHIPGWHVYSDWVPYPRGEELDADSINGCCFLVRRSVLEQIGFLDEGTFLFAEELILGRQFQELGTHGCLATGTVIHHDQGASTGHRGSRFDLRMELEMIRSELYYIRKYQRAGWWLLALVALVRGVDTAGRFLRRGSMRSPVSAGAEETKL